jgi:hypothetical protein
MMRNRAAKGATMVVFAILFLTVFSYGVMRLWNWLMPALFGWHLVSYWQAIGILVLSKILFGGFHGRHRGQMHWRHRVREWEQRMSPEERDRFRQNMRGRCGPFGPAGPAEAEPKM